MFSYGGLGSNIIVVLLELSFSSTHTPVSFSPKTVVFGLSHSTANQKVPICRHLTSEARSAVQSVRRQAESRIRGGRAVLFGRLRGVAPPEYPSLLISSY